MSFFGTNPLRYQEFRLGDAQRESTQSRAAPSSSNLAAIRERIRGNQLVIENLNRQVVRQKAVLYKCISKLSQNFYAEDILLQQAQSAVQLTVSALNEERRQAERSYEEIKRRLIEDYKMLIKEQQEGERIWTSKLRRFDE